MLTRIIRCAIEGAMRGREPIREGGAGLSGLSGKPPKRPSRERTVGKGPHAALSFVMCSV